jgi:outer membrane protein OmpA-like peptidoglycan-associated protein
MKISRNYFIPVAALAFALYLPACKTKKLMPKPAPAEVAVQKEAPVEAKKPDAPSPQTQEATPVVEKPDYNFSNLQFEFDSAILKTSSYAMMDKVALEMKKDASVKFMLKGYSSAEGTPEHNQSLSEERANAVKSYLINAGVDATQLTAKGYGESNPVSPNTTEDGKVLNRRVEINKL